MVTKAIRRALFVRSGFDAHVKGQIEKEQRRERNKTTQLEEQLRRLLAAHEGAEAKIAKLQHRCDELGKKYEAARQQIEQQRERFVRLKELLEPLDEARLDERMLALERARMTDLQERRRGLMADIEATFPAATLHAHMRCVIARSQLESDPFPHLVLDEVLPDAFHRMLYEARPPRGFWHRGQVGRENWTIGEDVGPLATEAAWGYMNDVVAAHVLMPELTVVFHEYLRAFDTDAVPDSSERSSRYEQSGGRLMLRRPGYTFEPHLDPPRALLTGLLYFGAPTDSHDHGTKLYRTDRPLPEHRQGVYYPLQEGASCELVKTVPSRPNSMLVFASRVGLHGADIPPDAQPAKLERYTYQFYIGETRRKQASRATAAS